MKKQKLTIGFLAKSAGVNIETVRYYERIKIIRKPDKPAEGFRTYPTETLKRIKFIKRAQQFGFNLKEIAELLQLGEGSGLDQCTDIRLRAEQKREKIDKQIKDLTSLRATLTQLINSCQSGSGNQHCAIVETLSA